MMVCFMSRLVSPRMASSAPMWSSLWMRGTPGLRWGALTPQARLRLPSAPPAWLGQHRGPRGGSAAADKRCEPLITATEKLRVLLSLWPFVQATNTQLFRLCSPKSLTDCLPRAGGPWGGQDRPSPRWRRAQSTSSRGRRWLSARAECGTCPLLSEPRSTSFLKPPHLCHLPQRTERD